MMESLTDDLVEKALEYIKEVEEYGGMTRYINSGTAKLRVEESATRKQARIDSGQETIVGVNKYRVDEKDAAEEMVDVLQIDNTKARNQQLERLRKVREGKDHSKRQHDYKHCPRR